MIAGASSLHGLEYEVFFVDAAAGFAEWCGVGGVGTFAWVQFFDDCTCSDNFSSDSSYTA